MAGDILRADEILGLVAADVDEGPTRAGILARRGYLALVLGRIDDAEALLLEALGMAAGDVRVRATIHSLLAGVGFLSWRDWRRARTHAFTALRLANDAGDAALEMQMLGHAATWLRSLGRPWRPMLERADTLAVPIDDVPILEHPDLQFARHLTVEGHVNEARRRLDRLIETARSGGDWMSLPRILAVLAEVESEAGAWDRAEQVAADAGIGLRQTGEGAYIRNVQLTLLGLRIARGDVDGARAMAAEIEPMTAASASRWVQDAVPIHLATLDLAVGDAASAHDRVAPALVRPGLGRLAAVVSERVVALDVEALVGLGRHADARRLLDPVERRARRRGIPAAVAEVFRVRALVLAADGSFAEAVSAAEEAVRIQAHLGAPFGRRAPGSRSVRCFAAHGRSRRRDAPSRRLSTGSSSSGPGSGPSAPGRRRSGRRASARRRPPDRVGAARRGLAAAGHTNREIAAELFMSVHTVEAHLTRVFRALGVQNRTELGRVVLDGAAEPVEARGDDDARPARHRDSRDGFQPSLDRRSRQRSPRHLGAVRDAGSTHMTGSTYRQQRSPAIALVGVALAASLFGGVLGGAVVGGTVGDRILAAIESLWRADAQDRVVLRGALDWERRYRQMYPGSL